MKIVGQLKHNPSCIQYRSRGFWTLLYTMSLWQDESSLKDFARHGAHLDGMKNSKNLATEIRTYTYEANQLSDWSTAKELLQKSKGLKF